MAKKLKRKGIREESVASDGAGEVSKKVKTSTRSLFEPGDAKGGYRPWKNVVTGDEIKLKKHDVPRQSKGSILADDVSLGMRFMANLRRWVWAKHYLLSLSLPSLGARLRGGASPSCKGSATRMTIRTQKNPTSMLPNFRLESSGCLHPTNPKTTRAKGERGSTTRQSNSPRIDGAASEGDRKGPYCCVP